MVEPCKPCPLSREHSLAEPIYHSEKAGLIQVVCLCGVSGPLRATKGLANAVWNRLPRATLKEAADAS